MYARHRSFPWYRTMSFEGCDKDPLKTFSRGGALEKIFSDI
jgi:hypothetical protein